MGEMSYKIEIKGIEELLRRLNASTQESVIKSSLKLSGLLLQGWSQKNRLTGPRPQFLGVKTGRLRSSITASEPIKEGDGWIEKIGTNVEYARIHEFGGRTGRGKGFLMPERPFLRPSIEDEGNRERILSIFTEKINKALEDK